MLPEVDVILVVLVFLILSQRLHVGRRLLEDQTTKHLQQTNTTIPLASEIRAKTKFSCPYYLTYLFSLLRSDSNTCNKKIAFTHSHPKSGSYNNKQIPSTHLYLKSESYKGAGNMRLIIIPTIYTDSKFASSYYQMYLFQCMFEHFEIFP